MLFFLPRCMFTCRCSTGCEAVGLHPTSARSLSFRGVAVFAIFSQARTPSVSAPHIQHTHEGDLRGGMEHSAGEQSIWPAGTNQANSGSRLDPVPSHPFSIYKTGLAYNEKHYLLPGHIILTSSRRRSYGARAKE